MAAICFLKTDIRTRGSKSSIVFLADRKYWTIFVMCNINAANEKNSFINFEVPKIATVSTLAVIRLSS